MNKYMYRLCLVLNILLMFMVLPFLPYAAAEESKERIAFSVSAVLSVVDPDKTGQELAGICEKSGGYYTRISGYQVSLRFPSAMRDKLASVLRDNGILVDYSVNSSDINQEFLAAVKQLEAREKLLLEYRRLIGSSNLSGTLSLERELTALFNEIEALKGRIRMFENRLDYLEAEISFYSEENPLPPAGESPFGWINRIDFYSFTGGYHGE